MALVAVKGGWVNSSTLIKLSESTVDGVQWYTVRCSDVLGTWVRQQPVNDWYEHIDQRWIVHSNTFDICEKLYTVLLLKVSE